MLKINHTVWPKGREPKATNEVKEGGLWYEEKQEELLKDAKKIVKRRDEWKELSIFFWQIVVALICLYIVISKI